jgi:two-component system cell cycle sensor histidine kinase/response regulator CckA
LVLPNRFLEAHNKGYAHFKLTGQGAAVGKINELVGLKKDGTEFPVELSVAPINLNGNWHAVGILRDTSERKKAEKENENLQAQIVQAGKMESVGRLAGGVAHDFNNMLGVIIGNAELELRQPNLPDSIQSSLREILSAAHHSAEITRHLLAFARKQPVSLKVLDLNEIISNMRNMIERLLGEQIELRWTPGENLSQVNLDPSQISQIIFNLAANGRDAIDGKGTITIETSSCDTPPGSAPAAYTLLEISDTGRGMDKEALKSIFDPFYSTKEFGKGTGLGLSIVEGIVKQNQGIINVYSEPGCGTTFKIYFPVVPRSINEGKSL